MTRETTIEVEDPEPGMADDDAMETDEVEP